MNRSEALAFFDAAYKRGMQWIDAMEFAHGKLVDTFRVDYHSNLPPRVRAVDVLESECALEDARVVHRETMAMIAWEVCGPSFAGAEAEARRIAGAIVEARRGGAE